MSLGIALLLVVLLGYFSNWINWRFLNFRIMHGLYYIGAFVHESSHALMCLFTRAKIREYVIFSEQPHVTYERSRFSFIGDMLISSAPVFGGLFFLFLLNVVLFDKAITIPIPEATVAGLLLSPLRIFASMHVFEWQSLVMLMLFLNVGAMLGPSIQDMKNMWLMLIVLFFVHIPSLLGFGLIALSLVLANIYLQLILILLARLLSWSVGLIRGV